MRMILRRGRDRRWRARSRAFWRFRPGRVLAPSTRRLRLAGSSAGDLCRRRGPSPAGFPRAGARAASSSRIHEHAEHVEERLAGGRGGVDRLLGGLEADALGAELANDILQVADRPGQPASVHYRDTDFRDLGQNVKVRTDPRRAVHQLTFWALLLRSFAPSGRSSPLGPTKR